MPIKWVHNIASILSRYKCAFIMTGNTRFAYHFHQSTNCKHISIRSALFFITYGESPHFASPISISVSLSIPLSRFCSLCAHLTHAKKEKVNVMVNIQFSGYQKVSERNMLSAVFFFTTSFFPRT